jgi:hypothetical protein
MSKIKKFGWFLNLVCPKDVTGITLAPFGIYIREEIPDTITINHESIHWKQQLEMLIIPFYFWYLIESIFKGYFNISFEQEAYTNQYNKDYLKTRKLYAWFKYLKKQK